MTQVIPISLSYHIDKFDIFMITINFIHLGYFYVTTTISKFDCFIITYYIC